MLLRSTPDISAAGAFQFATGLPLGVALLRQIHCPPPNTAVNQEQMANGKRQVSPPRPPVPFPLNAVTENQHACAGLENAVDGFMGSLCRASLPQWHGADVVVGGSAGAGGSGGGAQAGGSPALSWNHVGEWSPSILYRLSTCRVY